MINFKIFTLFPEIFPGALGYSITGDALKKNLWNYQAINIRDYAFDSRRTVDDTPYGGNAGMVFKPDVIANALEKNNITKESNLIYLSPRGKVFNQKMARDFAKKTELSILCARYEGVDQRVLDEFEVEEISIGDYVLSGGEIACQVMIDAILRNVEGVLGSKQSLDQESFGNDDNDDFQFLLEYPQYTKPSIWREYEVPEVLLSGHHSNIDKWRKEQAKILTKKNRLDLYQKYLLSSNSKS
jgi:tRNA (guanine37-N1)-methyltransferase